MIEKFACCPKGVQGLILWLMGAMTSLAFAPTFWIPLAIMGFSWLLIASSRDDIAMSRFWMGWFFGFGHFTVGLYWTSYAMLVDAKDETAAHFYRHYGFKSLPNQALTLFLPLAHVPER